MTWDAIERERERNKELFAIRVQEALNLALSNQTVIIVVPEKYPKGYVLNMLVARVPKERTHLIRMPGNEMHFEGSRGSVRIFDNKHVEYDARQKRIVGYPVGISTFLHPEVEEA